MATWALTFRGRQAVFRTSFWPTWTPDATLLGKKLIFCSRDCCLCTQHQSVNYLKNFRKQLFKFFCFYSCVVSGRPFQPLTMQLDCCVQPWERTTFCCPLPSDIDVDKHSVKIITFEEAFDHCDTGVGLCLLLPRAYTLRRLVDLPF